MEKNIIKQNVLNAAICAQYQQIVMGFTLWGNQTRKKNQVYKSYFRNDEFSKTLKMPFRKNY